MTVAEADVAQSMTMCVCLEGGRVFMLGVGVTVAKVGVFEASDRPEGNIMVVVCVCWKGMIGGSRLYVVALMVKLVLLSFCVDISWSKLRKMLWVCMMKNVVVCVEQIGNVWLCLVHMEIMCFIESVTI